MNTPLLDKRPPLTTHRIGATLAAASADSGRGKAAIFASWLCHGLFPKRMFLDEFTGFGLHRAGADPDDWIGIAQSQRFNMGFNGDAPAQRALMSDKRLYATLLAGAGIAAPKVIALTHPDLGDPDASLPRDEAQIADWLHDAAPGPIFGKPLKGYGSEGVVSIDRIDPDAGMLTLVDGREVPFANLARTVFRRYGADGYLWMPRLAPHPDLAAVAGPTLGCVRLVALTGHSRFQPLYALWKVPAIRSAADNFWRKGNMLARLDPATGRIAGVRAKGGAEDVDTHPQTGQALTGRMMPDWDALLETARVAALLTPEIHLIGWDIGLTDDGPAIIEGNTNPDHRLWQFANGKGFLTPEHRALAAEARKALDHRRNARKQARRAGLRLRRGSDIPRVLENLFRDKP